VRKRGKSPLLNHPVEFSIRRVLLDGESLKEMEFLLYTFLTITEFLAMGKSASLMVSVTLKLELGKGDIYERR
jgi:hypothetical protein